MSDVAGAGPDAIDRALGAVHYDRDGSTVLLTFDRPGARNAMTETMYAQLESNLERAASEDGVRVVVLRGAAGSFVAGTDIARFTEFRSGDDGLRYERRIDDIVGNLESLPIPTVAVVEGYAAGAGLMLAAVCDLRVCTSDARFGAPIARTVGNCLSMANVARLIAHFGVARTKQLLFTAEFMSAELAHATGFVLDVVPAEQIESRVRELCEQIASHAPVTLSVTKESIRRLIASGIPSGDDLIRRAYESNDFREGVKAFLAKRPPFWEGA